MANLTYTGALANNELVSGTPGVNQEQITGNEILSSTSNTIKDSGARWNALKQWIQLDASYMDKGVYDTTASGRVDKAEAVDDGTNSTSAAEVRSHIDNAGIHFIINDASTSAAVALSASYIKTALSDLNTNKADQTDLDAHTGDATIHFVINDVSTLTTVAWSGSKLNSEFNLKADQSDLTAHTTDATIHFVINDGSTAANVAWSGSKINTELSAKASAAALTAHTSDSTIHFVINDAGTSLLEAWSASKINTELGLKATETDLTNHTGNTSIHQTTAQTLTACSFQSYVGFATVGATPISVGGTTNINFSSSNIHRLTGTGNTGIGSFTFPSANGKYSLTIPSSVNITSFSTTNKITYGASPDLSSGAYRFLAIHWDGTNAHCFVSRQGTW